MKTTHVMSVRLSAMLLILLFCSTAFAGSAKVEVCHIPPDNPDNYHTIRINENALASHLAHFDLVGPCDTLCAQLCDDGNACTIDDTNDCEQNGCPAVSEPVDCGDGNACTDDLCDPVSGCSNPVAVTCESPNLCITSACDPIAGICEETPKSCDPGELCNSSNGLCEPEDPGVSCSCFDEAFLLGLGEVDPTQCGDDYPFAGIAAVFYTNGSFACSGSGCSSNAADPDVGCAYVDNTTEVSVLGPPISDEEDAACRALIASTCPQ